MKLTKKNFKLSVSKYFTASNMECKTNRESVKDVEENLETNSEIALWKFIGPKIGEARNILFSAILDILDKSKSEERTLKRDSLNSMHWKNTKKSIWTLSTTTEQQGSLRNTHLDSSVFQVLDDFSFTTDNKGTSRQSFNFKNQSTENLEDVVLGRKNALCVRLNRRAKETTGIAKSSLQEKKRAGTSSMGLFSRDSITSKKSYYSVKRKKNLVIKCDYSNKSNPLSKHILQVYQHQSSQIQPLEKSTNVSKEKLFIDNNKGVSKETKYKATESKSNVANTNTVKTSFSKISCEKKNYEKSRRQRRSVQPKWSFMSLNRRGVNRRKHEVKSGQTSTQSTSYRAKFSKILSRLFNAGLQISSLTHRKDVEERKNFSDSTPSASHTSSDTSTLSADRFRISSKSRTSKRQDLFNKQSSDIPPRIALSYNNIPCAAPLFVPILNLPGSEHCEKELKKPCKSPDNKPSINSNLRLYPRSSKTRRLIDSFCGLKSRILASASRGKPPESPTPPLSSRTSIFFPCSSKTSYGLDRPIEKLPSESSQQFSRIKREHNRHDPPILRSDIPPGLRYARRHSPKIVTSGIKRSNDRFPRKRSFDHPKPPIIDPNWDSSNSDLANSEHSFTLLSKEALFPNISRNPEPFWIPEQKYSYDTPRYSVPPPKPSSPDDIFSSRQLYERPKVNYPYSPPYSQHDFDYHDGYNPYRYIQYPRTSDDNMDYSPDYMFPQYLSVEKEYPPSSMFSRAPSFIPARPISCPFPGLPSNLSPHLTAHQHPSPYYYNDPYLPPNYSYLAPHPYFVDPFTSCSTGSPTSSGSSVHYQPDNRGNVYYGNHDVPPSRIFREHSWYLHGQNTVPKVFDYEKYMTPDDQEEFSRFSKSKSHSEPAYITESFGSESFLEPKRFVSKVRRSEMPQYMEYPHSQVPFNTIHPSSQHYYPQFPENPRELTHSSHRCDYRKHPQINIMNRSCYRKLKASKSSCHSILLDQRISTRKTARYGRQLIHNSSSVNSITFNPIESPKFESESSTESCSDVSVSRSSATVLLSKYKLADVKNKYQFPSSCTSSKTQTSESIMNIQSSKRRKKRVSCDCPKSPSKPMPFERKKLDTDPRHEYLFHCNQNVIPSVSYRNMIGLRSQVCSSATDVYWNFKFKYGKIKHFDDRIKYELQKIGIDQLIEASKPAKCCKKTILNQPTKGNLPYAASLASLPLDETDIKVIKQSVKMASKKKDFNSGDSPENRKKLMYYANILTDDYNMRKPKVEPQFEIRYMYYKLDDKKNVENLVNRKYNEKIRNKFYRFFSFILEIPIHNPKLILEKSTNLNDHFDKLLVKSVIEEKQSFGNFTTIVPYERSRILREYLMIKRGNPPGIPENSNVALCSNFSSCSEPHFYELFFKDEKSFLSRIYNLFSSMNISEVYRKLKKKTKKCLNSEEILSKINIYDLNELMKSQMIETIIDKYQMIVIYSVQYSESRIWCKNICEHNYNAQQRSIFSTPSIQLRVESCLSGLEAILRIIANFKTYVEKAIKDDDNLLDNLEQYLRLKMYVSIRDTFDNAIHFEVNIDKFKNVCSFSSSKGKLTRKDNFSYCKSQNSERKKIGCDNNKRLIKLIHQNRIVYSRFINIEKLSSKLMQELVTMSRNGSLEENFNISSLTSKNTRFSEGPLCLRDNFNGLNTEEFNDYHTVYKTKNECSKVELSILRNRELLSKHFLQNISRNKRKLIIDSNKLNMIRIIFENQKKHFNWGVFFSLRVLLLGDNQLSDVPAFNETVFVMNDLQDSKNSFLQMMSSRKNIDELDIYYADVKVLTTGRILCTMLESPQLDSLREILPNICGIMNLFQSNFCHPIFLSINPLKFIKYSICYTEIPNYLLNNEKIKSLQHLEKYFINIHKTLFFQMRSRCLPTTGNQIQNKTVENYHLFNMGGQLYICETIRTAEHQHNQVKIKKMKGRQQKKNISKKICESSFSYYNLLRCEEYQIDINEVSGSFSGKLEIEDEKTGDYGKQSSKRCQQKLPSKETKVTTILPCCGASGGIVQRSGDSLESLLDDCLENGKLMNQGDNQRNERRKTINYKMVEDTLMECLNLKGNSDPLQGMSHTILRYFTYTVFSEIKKNYYKHVLRKHRHSCCKKNHQDFNIAFFNSKHTHAFPLGNLDKKHEEMESGPKPIKPRSKNEISSNQNHENKSYTTDPGLSISNIEAKISSKDAFLCNLPNAPPFILKMNKTSFGTELMTEKEEASNNGCKETCAVKNDISSVIDCLEHDRVSHNSPWYPSNKRYSEMSEHNLFIDNTCPTISNREFRTFLGKSISFIKNSKGILQDASRGCFMSSPTICLTGLSGFSMNPFTMDEKDSRKRCQHIAYRPSTDILCNENSHQHQSKIPRMLHPGKYKVHTKMKNVQITSSSKGYGKSQACSSRGCRDHCAAENSDVQINTIHNMVDACPSKTKTCAAASARSDKRGSVIKSSSQPPMGDCVKGIRSDPGCYCPNIRDESIPCPVRLKESFPLDEEETAKEEEDTEDLCRCAPGEQPLLMKKSNIECDCANRNRCENETLVEPPVEKPNVFWALTKVSLLKDGTKNFEIIDVSPLPPGYYLMPEPNNLILVGQQPKPVKAPPSKNCSCK